jgi:hypothetical protein
VGTGVTCTVVALLDDRDVMPGWALAQIAFAGAVLLSLLRFSGDVDFGELSAWLVVVYFVSMLVSGGYAAWIAWREGFFAPIEGAGGIPVEPRVTAPAPLPGRAQESVFSWEAKASGPASDELVGDPLGENAPWSGEPRGVQPNRPEPDTHCSDFLQQITRADRLPPAEIEEHSVVVEAGQKRDESP